MKNIVKESYRGFKGWLYYIRDYKDNVENEMISQQMLVDANTRIELLSNELKHQEDLYKEQSELLSKRNDRIKILTDKLTDEKILNKMHIETIEELTSQIDEMEQELKDKNKTIKKLNMKYAFSQRKIKKQEKDIQRKDHKINFLLASKEAPSKEKIMAYEKCMKEVEKRQKENDRRSNNNI